MTTNYEKTEKRSFKDFQNSTIRKTYGQPSEWLAHKAGFLDGYNLGKSETARHLDGFNQMKRQQIALAAMQGILSNPQLITASITTMQKIHGEDFTDLPRSVSAIAVNCADALIDELNNNANDTHIHQ